MLISTTKTTLKCTHPPELALLVALCVFLPLTPAPYSTKYYSQTGAGVVSTTPLLPGRHVKMQGDSSAVRLMVQHLVGGARYAAKHLNKARMGTYDKELLPPTINNAEVEKPYSRRKSTWVMVTVGHVSDSRRLI